MPPTPPAVRVARLEDLPDIVEIYNHYVLTSPSTFEIEPVRTEDRVSWFHEHAASGPHRLMVATDPSDRPIGWASSSSFRPRAAYRTTVESSVYLRSGETGRGLGRALYSELFAAICDEDVERIVAGICIPNPASVALHRRFGFREVGVFTRVGRKFDRYWDVAWFERPLRLPSGASTAPSP